MNQLLERERIFTPPAQETYGRSLSSLRRLGNFMIKQTLEQSIDSPEAAQVRAEFFTSVEEGFGTDRELGGGLEVRDFDSRPVHEGKVMSRDLKTAISDMTEAGIDCAEETAKQDSRFAPQVTRSIRDHENAQIVDKMASCETDYNTRIVISPFPEEAAAKSGDAYWRRIGYVPHLKRGFVQLYHANGTELTAGSLSFDGSDKKRLREVFAKYGVEIPEGEVTDNWLKYAVTGNFDESQAKALALEIADQVASPEYKKSTNTVDVTGQYHDLIDQVFNESYVHVCESLVRGAQTDAAASLIHQLAGNAKHFNHRYRIALNRMAANKNLFTADDSAVLHELLVYSTIEMMRAFHLKNSKNHHGHSRRNGGLNHLNPTIMTNRDPRFLQIALSNFAADGARNGRGYSACGLEIAAGISNEIDRISNLQQAFGGAIADEETWLKMLKKASEDNDEFGSLEFKCTKGCHNRRSRGKLLKECKYVKYCKGKVAC